VAKPNQPLRVVEHVLLRQARHDFGAANAATRTYERAAFGRQCLLQVIETLLYTSRKEPVLPKNRRRPTHAKLFSKPAGAFPEQCSVERPRRRNDADGIAAVQRGRRAEVERG